MNTIKELLSVESLRLRLLAGCIGMAVVVSGIFIITSYRLSSDMGTSLERESLLKLGNVIANQIRTHLPVPERLTHHLEESASAGGDEPVAVYLETNNQVTYSGAQANPQLTALILAAAKRGEKDGKITFENENYLWMQTTFQQDDKSLLLVLFKPIDSLDRALNFIANRLSITAFLTFWGAVWAALIIAAVITRRVEQSNTALAYLATHDALTDLKNRTSLIQQINEFLINNSNKQSPSEAALLVIDLNKFKEINDSLGHAFGDIYLIALAKRIKTLESQAHVFRYGGDEFVIWQENVKGTDLIQLAEQVTELCQQPILIDGEYIEVSASIGVATYPKDASSAESLLQNADIAMYRAKNLRVNYMLYRESYHSANSLKLKLRSQIATGIENNEFILFYQPKVALANQNIYGVEALVRWQHPVEGLLFPDIFIELIEQSGIVHNFSRYILEQAIQQAAKWQAAGTPISIAVNLSPYNMADLSLADFIQAKLDQYNVAPHFLEIELTESASMIELYKTAAMFRTLQKMGLKVSIDDFGTGMSSLAYLKDLNVDFVKLDRSFISNMIADKESLAMVEGILSLCKHMQKAVVAEGVETQEQADILARLGCQFAQGYLFSKPKPAEELQIEQSATSVNAIAL